MKLCTLALGDRYLRLADRLKNSLPTEIEIFTDVPPDIARRKADGQYNHHNKRLAIERHYCAGGTLYLDADTLCVDQSAFLDFLQSLASLPPGLYSPYTFSSYGFKHPTLPDKVIDRTRLTRVLTFVDSAVGLSHEELLELRMPFEWLMFFRFESAAQKDSFFDRYRHFHAIVMDSPCTLANDCNLIGLSAQHCKLPVIRLPKISGIRHKE